MTTIVCYMGGTCGDLVSALIDVTGVELQGSTVQHITQRARLKKPHLFKDDAEKDLYIEMAGEFGSISSHDLDYHLRRQHEFLAVIVNDQSTANWAAERFQTLHRPQVWKEVSTAMGIQSYQDYAQMMLDYSAMVANHTRFVVKLQNILEGHAVEDLESLGIAVTPQACDFYHKWLQQQ